MSCTFKRLSGLFVFLFALAILGCASGSNDAPKAQSPKAVSSELAMRSANPMLAANDKDESVEVTENASKPTNKAPQDEKESGVTYILDKEIIHTVVAEHNEELLNCYAEELAVKKGLKGKIVVAWTVMEDGTVADAKITETTMKNENVENCMIQNINKWKFPVTGTKASVDYPFEFDASK